MLERLLGTSFWSALFASLLLFSTDATGMQSGSSGSAQDEQQRQSSRSPRPDIAPRPARSEPPDEQGGGSGRGGGGARGGWQEPSPEQWERALAFLRDNAPRRLEVYERAFAHWREQNPTTQPSELPRSIRGARARIYWRIRMLQTLEERDPSLYELELRLFRLEDEIIGAMADARRARETNDETAAAEANQKAREAVQSYALGVLEQREARIARLRQELAREEQRLESDRANMEQLIERLSERFRRSVPGEGEQQHSEGDSRGGKGPGG